MAENNSGPIEAVRGIVSGAIGFTEQVVGLILSRSELQEEGRAQVEKASHQLDAARAEAEADTARAKAKAQETRQQGCCATASPDERRTQNIPGLTAGDVLRFSSRSEAELCGPVGSPPDGTAQGL